MDFPKRIHGLNKGRARVWWVTHRRDAKHAALLMGIVALLIVTMHFDYRDQLAQQEAICAAADAKAERFKAFSADYPRITFVLEADSPAALRMRLADIAGAADVERMKLK